MTNTLMQTELFIEQETRLDVLKNMYINLTSAEIMAPTNPGKAIYDWIMTDNIENPKSSRKGFLFETVCQILISLKCIISIDYTEILGGQLTALQSIETLNALLDIPINQGNNKSDLTVKLNDTVIPISIKYKTGYGETDVVLLDTLMKECSSNRSYKIGLIVKNKNDITDHIYLNKDSIYKKHHELIQSNGLLLDETDIIRGMETFHSRYFNLQLTVDPDQFVDYLNEHVFNSVRISLSKKLHQQMTLLKFQQSLSANTTKKMYCISHKPRSGKSITMLLMCKHLLENGYNRILILTSVPSTIQSFIHDLDNYLDFRDINYEEQDNFKTISPTFRGIVFCSIQYLKTDPSKKDLLTSMQFDAFFPDEAHLGISTDKSKDTLSTQEKGEQDNESLVKSLQQSINKLTVFASGTADKIKLYYRIPSQNVYEWDIEDESAMKVIHSEEEPESIKQQSFEFMVMRHGQEFQQCHADTTLNQDYSKHPTQVLMKYSVPKLLEEDINKYNRENNTAYGFSCKSLLALKQKQNKKTKQVEYVEEFELCKDNDGVDILRSYFEQFISNQRMRSTIMKQIEQTQSSRGSRKTSVENPKLFLVYLPVNTGNGTIDKLQRTIITFLSTHKLWTDYHITFSNGTTTSADAYTQFVEEEMARTKRLSKRGCILLLGNQGTVGITYKDCDVTISLDDGHNLDNLKQRFSRALTETADGTKKIGINVDMNIQRSYQYLLHMIHRHRTTTKSTQSNAEILYYLYTHNVFLFDPQELSKGNLSSEDIMDFYQKESVEMMKHAMDDDTEWLEQIVCNDDLREYIHMDFQHRDWTVQKEANPLLEGENQDCPKGESTAHLADGPDHAEQDTEKEEPLSAEEVNSLVNQTYEMCKSFMFPLLALISRTYKIPDFKLIFTHPATEGLMRALLENKKIEVKGAKYNIINNIMAHIIDANEEIVNNIREIYSTAPSHKLRTLIEKHFIPTQEEKKGNAEVPTPVVLVDEMLDKMPVDFWKSPKQVFEPCCGKGNFVLGIFDRFWNGLEEMFPEPEERCQVILSCIHYADISALNVFITTELLRCHYQSYCGVETEEDVVFNSYVGDTLAINTQTVWGIPKFDAVIGNPPYNASGSNATGNTIWQHFTLNSLTKWLSTDGYLLFVHPPGWRKPNTEKGKFTRLFELMTHQNQMLYLEIHGIKDGQKTFKCGTRYDFYVIQKTLAYTNTMVVDEEGVMSELNMGEWKWLPNSNIMQIKRIMAGTDDEKCPIMYDRTAYGADKKDRVSSTQTQEFKYPLVHSTPKNGTRHMYSKVNDRGHFGVSKVIFGESGINNPVIDMDGTYGMTHGAMAIKVDTIEEATNIRNCIITEEFDKLIQGCIYSSFRIDWNLFKEFKKDFWREFV
jgi:hypothetical protein